MKKVILAVGSAMCMLASTPAYAVLNIPVPTSAYITYGGLDWAWAIPLPGSSFPNALSYQGTQGWRAPTVAELSAAPLATDFLKAGGNTPFGGTGADGSQFQATNSAYTAARSAGACASVYFNTGYNHCDWQDGNGQPNGPWAGTAGAASFADQLFVRSVAVPEPGTWAMMLGGFGVLGGALRNRRRRVSVTYA